MERTSFSLSNTAVRGRLGDDAKKEGQSIFNILTGTAILILIKDNSNEHTLNYYDIGDYLSKEEKLNKLRTLKSINNIKWDIVTPDENNDWINQRDEKYEEFTPLLGDIFLDKAVGVSTSRDVWVYGFSKEKLQTISHTLVNNYNAEIDRLSSIKEVDEKLANRNMEDSFIKWSVGLSKSFAKSEKISLDDSSIKLGMYRPFCKKWIFFDKKIIERPGRWDGIMSGDNRIICTTGVGARREFSALVVKDIPNYDLMEKCQGYYLYDDNDKDKLFNNNFNIEESLSKRIGLSDEEVFYYVYAILNCTEYKNKYSNDLNKSVPRIPILKNKEIFVKVGRKLADLHLNYEEVPQYEELNIKTIKEPSYKVTKMKHPKRDQLETIIFNGDITITNIPTKAYDYVVNGRSAIEWIIDQYQIKEDKKSGIVDDPNQYSNDEKYIFNLLLRIINVSVQTVDLINSLPPLEIEE